MFMFQIKFVKMANMMTKLGSLRGPLGRVRVLAPLRGPAMVLYGGAVGGLMLLARDWVQGGSLLGGPPPPWG